MDDHLCDVVLKSDDGTEHRAHTAVLSAASAFFKNLLGGSFLEAQRVQQKQPVEVAASKEAVCALLDYIYDGQPEVPVEVALELLQLAGAYDLPKLAGSIETGIRACLDRCVALQVLQEAHGLHSLRAACEDKVAEEFEACSKHPDFGKLRPSQLARILKREDLAISREEEGVHAIFTWNKVSKDGHTFLASCCNMYISILFPLRICFALAVQLSLVLVVTTFTEKLRRLWPPGREPQVQLVEEASFPALVTIF